MLGIMDNNLRKRKIGKTDSNCVVMLITSVNVELETESKKAVRFADGREDYINVLRNNCSTQLNQFRINLVTRLCLKPYRVAFALHFNVFQQRTSLCLATHFNQSKTWIN